MLATNIAGLSVRVDAVERQTDGGADGPDEADFQPYHVRIKRVVTGGYRIALVKTGAISGGFFNEVRGDFILEYQRPAPSGIGVQSVFTEHLRYRGLKPVRVENDTSVPGCPGGRDGVCAGRQPAFWPEEQDRAQVHRVS